MSAFNAINIELEEGQEDEIDDSKELQIEEALRHYQNAVKLHSLGPEYFENAAIAYKLLFGSEIFTYPESASTFQQYEAQGDVDENDDLLERLDQSNHVVPTAATNETPSSLPQILYLAYKNYAQFLLDQLRFKLSYSASTSSPQDGAIPPNSNEIRSTVLASLHFLVEALDRDATDVQLWRQTSRLCEFVGSRRMARFCLEAAIETDDGDYDTWPEPQGLDESLAAEQLEILLQSLADDVAEAEITNFPGRKAGLVQSLKRIVDPCPYLPTPPDSPDNQPLKDILNVQTVKEDIVVPKRTWESLGKSILVQISGTAQDPTQTEFGTAYHIVLPSVIESDPQFTTGLRGGGTAASGMKISVLEKPPSAMASPTEALTTEIDIARTKDSRDSKAEQPTSEQLIMQAAQEVDQSGFEKPRNLQDISPDVVVTNPRTSLADVQVTPRENPIEQIPESPRTTSLPTRKRSSETAGFPEAIDSGRSKSKRIKARVSTADGLNDDVANHFEQQLKENIMADSALFESTGAPLSKLEVNRLGTVETLRASISHSDQSPVDSGDVAAQDLKLMLTSWNPERSNIFLRKSKGNDEFTGANGVQNFTTFLESSKRGTQAAQITTSLGEVGLDDFARDVNRGWTQLDALALAYLEKLLTPSGVVNASSELLSGSTYDNDKWSESLKHIVVQTLVQRDECIYSRLTNRLESLDCQNLTELLGPADEEYQGQGETLAILIQNIFEIHLDVYERITNPSSEVDLEIRTMQLDRLGRWSSLSTNALNRVTQIRGDAALDQLAIRFLWASVVYVNLTDSSAREHNILCFKDLIVTLENAGKPVINLPNNAAMPEVSVEAAEREISSLTTMDFFLGIFSSDSSEPLAIIDSLEPILEGLVSSTDIHAENDGHSQLGTDLDQNRDEVPPGPNMDFRLEHGCQYDPRTNDMVQYLRKASLPLRLYLWQKLGSAYEAIHYSPSVLVCNFRRIELMMNHITSQEYYTSTREARQLDLLGWIRDMDALVTTNLSFVMNEADAFEFTGNDELRSFMSAMSVLQRVIHTYILWKDSVRIGQTPTFQPPRGSTLSGQTASMNKFEHLQVKAWMLQYMLLKEAIVQEPTLLETPGQYLLEHLNLLHDSLGLRDLCGHQSKQFLRLIRSEMTQHKVASGNYTAILKDGTSNWDRDFAQIIFDLHGIKILPNWWGLRYHGCNPDPLDRDVALELLEFVIVHANRMSIRDLAKSELRGAIDKIQSAIKLYIPISDTTFNKRSISAYLKRPVNPLDMYRSFRGVIDIISIEVRNESTAVADKGWYFLLGQLSLAKFRAQNRTIAGPLDDLDNAMIYFRQDLELGMEKWETWYRLAQVYDVKIEEHTKWNASKLTTAMEELKALQRNSIHCYTMAVSTAARTDASLEDVGKMPELYYDFALRVYASSREPFSMRAFGLEDFERHYNNLHAGMYKGRPFKGLYLYSAWDFAKVLLQRAVARKPQAWASWYLLGKCLWKMHNCDDGIRDGAKQISVDEVLYAVERAVETVSQRREKEPILEPHYKLLSIIHKLVQKQRLGIASAVRHLQATSYAQKTSFTGDASHWSRYVSDVLKVLRAADKPNWHHRMAARAAHIAYDTTPDNIDSAKAAKEELMQQIFTKTMNIQVWRPEHERAGRHFVYTTRYVNFLVQLLLQIGDTVTLEALAKKIRKKAGEFIGHSDLWESICGKYLNLLRSRGNIQYGHFDRLFKTVPLEVFMLNADRLDEWTHKPDFSLPIIDLIRETIELRKLNINLMKVSPIEELVSDAYATLYEQLLPDIIAKSNDEENRVRMRVDHVLAGPELSMNNSPAPDQSGRPEEAPAARARVKGVTRREVQKRAEALVARTAAPTAAVNVVKSTESATAPAVEEAGPSTGLSPMPGREGNIEDDASSEPGSLHDSADESELSDVEDFVDAVEEAQDARSSKSKSGSPKSNWMLQQYERQYVSKDDDEEEDEEREAGVQEAAEDEGEDDDGESDGPPAEILAAEGSEDDAEKPEEDAGQPRDEEDMVMRQDGDESQ